MAETRDCVIVGAGPAGSALAYFLASHGCDVLLLDRAAFPRDKTCGDGLTPRALGVLRTMGLLEAVEAAGCRLNGIRIYAPNGRLVESPIPAWHDLPQFLVVLPRFQLDDLIRQHAVKAGAEFRAPCDVTDVLREGQRVVGVCGKTPAGPLEVRARQVVFATGASVGLLERTGLLQRPAQFGRAARGYYQEVPGLQDCIEFHLESIPLPGYGWIFPTSPTTANVGVGYFLRNGQRSPRSSPRQALDEFLAHPLIAKRMAGARVSGPVKSYPLRFDFPTAVVGFPGAMLVGEAAGLVNPLTGEGIDYALESAEVAAEVLGEALRNSSPTSSTAMRYGRALRGRFLRTFLMICRVRDFYFHTWILNRAISAARREAEFRRTLMQICLGHMDPAQVFSPRMLWQLALG